MAINTIQVVGGAVAASGNALGLLPSRPGGAVVFDPAAFAVQDVAPGSVSPPGSLLGPNTAVSGYSFVQLLPGLTPTFGSVTTTGDANIGGDANVTGELTAASADIGLFEAPIIFDSAVVGAGISQEKATGTAGTTPAVFQLATAPGQNATGGAANASGGNLYILTGLAGVGGSGAPGHRGTMVLQGGDVQLHAVDGSQAISIPTPAGRMTISGTTVSISTGGGSIAIDASGNVTIAGNVASLTLNGAVTFLPVAAPSAPSTAGAFALYADSGSGKLTAQDHGGTTTSLTP